MNRREDVCPNYGGSDAVEFLKRATDGKHRIVSSGDLSNLQISEAQANNRFFVDEETGLGWALVPWELTTAKDRRREEEFFEARKVGFAELQQGCCMGSHPFPGEEKEPNLPDHWIGCQPVEDHVGEELVGGPVEDFNDEIRWEPIEGCEAATTDFGWGQPSTDLLIRFSFHPPKFDQATRYQAIRDQALEFANFIEKTTPKSREQSLALTKLEEAVFWANAAIARNE